MPYSVFKEQRIKGEANSPADSTTASLCARFYKLHAESAAAQRERALQDSRKVEGLGPLTELTLELGLDSNRVEAAVRQDTSDSEPKNTVATQMQAADKTQSGSSTRNADNRNKAGPPPKPGRSNSSISPTNSFDKRSPSRQHYATPGQANASNEGNVPQQMDSLNSSSFSVSTLPQGLPYGQNADLVERDSASNTGYAAQQTIGLDTSTFSTFPTSARSKLESHGIL